MPESLCESELSGHERGTFTGAHAKKVGLVEGVDGGTLFLDEVGGLPLSLQVKLLRLLETGTYRRVDSTEARQADFRLMTATHRNLQVMVAHGMKPFSYSIVLIFLLSMSWSSGTCCRWFLFLKETGVSWQPDLASVSGLYLESCRI